MSRCDRYSFLIQNINLALRSIHVPVVSILFPVLSLQPMHYTVGVTSGHANLYSESTGDEWLGTGNSNNNNNNCTIDAVTESIGLQTDRQTDGLDKQKPRTHEHDS